jgi:hypothetical protein
MIGEEEGADADSAPWIAVLVWCGKKVNILPFRFWNNQSGSPDPDLDFDPDKKYNGMISSRSRHQILDCISFIYNLSFTTN